MLISWIGIVEINIAIMCSCMPSYSAYIRRHLQLFRQLKSHMRVGGPWNLLLGKPSTESRKHSDSERIFVTGAAECNPSSCDAGGDMHHRYPLTLGSAIRDGKFLQTHKRSQFARSQYLQSPSPADQLQSVAGD